METITNDWTKKLEATCRGESTSVTISWDREDVINEGVAYRDSADGTSGPLEFVEWRRSGKLVEAVGFQVGNYFGDDDIYSGPEQDGIYPYFE